MHTPGEVVDRHGGRTPALVGGFALLLVLVAVTAALWAGHRPAGVGLGGPSAVVSSPDLGPAPLASASAGAATGGSDGATSLSVSLFLAIGVAVLAVGIVMLLRRRIHPEGRPQRVGVHVGTGDGTIALAAERDAALDDLSRNLADGADAREVVIACWVRLEAAAAAAGSPRRPSETSTEFAARVLGRQFGHGGPAGGLDPDVDVLAGLFREARFSGRPVTDAMRTDAVAALRRLRAAAR